MRDLMKHMTSLPLMTCTNYGAISRKDEAPDTLDLASYKETLGQLLGEWHENDTDAVAAIMAEYLTGPADAYAGAKAFRLLRERAESIIERSKE